MTREEAITKIFNEYSVPTSNPFFFDIIEALEPKTDVLGKIRDEIENYDNYIICANGQKGIHIDKALEIIDKYKAESEET